MSIADDLEFAAQREEELGRHGWAELARKAAVLLHPGQDDEARAREIVAQHQDDKYSPNVQGPRRAEQLLLDDIVEALAAERARERTRCAGIARKYGNAATVPDLISAALAIARAIEAEEPA